MRFEDFVQSPPTRSSSPLERNSPFSVRSSARSAVGRGLEIRLSSALLRIDARRLPFQPLLMSLLARVSLTVRYIFPEPYVGVALSSNIPPELRELTSRSLRKKRDRSLRLYGLNVGKPDYYSPSTCGQSVSWLFNFMYPRADLLNT